MSTSDAADTPTKWEYMELDRKTQSYLVNELNLLGKEGWELVSVTFLKGVGSGMGSNEAWIAFLKRPYTGAFDQMTSGEAAVGTGTDARTSRKEVELTDDDIFAIEDDD